MEREKPTLITRDELATCEPGLYYLGERKHDRAVDVTTMQAIEGEWVKLARVVAPGCSTFEDLLNSGCFDVAIRPDGKVIWEQWAFASEPYLGVVELEAAV